MLIHARSLRSIEIPRSAADIIMVTAFAAATALGAFIRIPVPGTPVPFTLQVYFVLFGAMLLGMRRGALSQLVYLGCGIAGVPIFAGAGAGLAYLGGPTGGYLIGFIAAAVMVGVLSARKTLLSFMLAALFGAAIIHAFGVFHIAVLLGRGFKTAFLAGSCPFIAADIVKAVLAALSARELHRRWSFPS